MVLVPTKPALWMMGIPLLSQTVLMGEILRGDWPLSSWFALAGLAAALLGALCTAATVRLLGSEKVVFGR